MNRVRAAGVAAILALTVAGCGGEDESEQPNGASAGVPTSSMGAPADGGSDSDQTQSDAEPVDVCVLFTKEDFAQVMGKPAGSQNVSSVSELGGCVYRSANRKSTVSLDGKGGNGPASRQVVLP